MLSNRKIVSIVLAFVLSFVAFFMVSRFVVQAFSGPPADCAPPDCMGAIGVSSSNNLSVGTSAPIADTKFLITASSTDSSNYALQIQQPGGIPIFVVRNDGHVGIGTANPEAAVDVTGSAVEIGTSSGSDQGVLLPRGRNNGSGGPNAIGSFPGWNLNMLYLNTYSNSGQQESFASGTTVTGDLYTTGDISAPGLCLGGVCSSAWPSGLKGSGTVNYFSKFTSSGSLGDSQFFDNGTDVGIGTTTPAYKLDVAGQIRSGSGGFVFPDGSVQTTAANSGDTHVFGWAVFDGATDPPTLLRGYNVSSSTAIGDNGAGYYYVNWATAVPASVCSAGSDKCSYAAICTASGSRCEVPTAGSYPNRTYVFTTQGGTSNALQDDPLITVMVFY